MRSYESYLKVIICRHMKKVFYNLVWINKTKIMVENTNCQEATRGLIFSKLKSFNKN